MKSFLITIIIKQKHCRAFHHSYVLVMLSIDLVPEVSKRLTDFTNMETCAS